MDFNECMDFMAHQLGMAASRKVTADVTFKLGIKDGELVSAEMGTWGFMLDIRQKAVAEKELFEAAVKAKMQEARDK